MIKFANDKAWIEMSSALFDGFIETDSLQAVIDNAVSTEVPPALKCKVSRIPNDLMSRVLGTIRKFHHAEIAWQLYYSVKDDAWDIYCPEQDASSGSVRFEDNKELDEYNAALGYYRVGTIHTHPHMSAFWSGTDMRDQKGFPGIHIVLGTDRDGIVNSTKATVFMSYGYRDIDFNEIVEPISFTDNHKEDVCWLLKLQTCLEANKRKRLATYTNPVPKIARAIFPAGVSVPTSKEPMELDEGVKFIPVSEYDPKLRKYGRRANIAIAEFASYLWYLKDKYIQGDLL
jgi:proteasome lid subunit RPN8/RPN11